MPPTLTSSPHHDSSSHFPYHHSHLEATTTTITMVRGNATQIKVHHQGKDEDFIIFVDSKEAVQNWKKDRSIPLAQVVSGFKILTSHK